MPSSKKRSQGAGRTANSEPRIQMFNQFGGCNFQESPNEFDLEEKRAQEQSDLQMNFLVLQNNVDCVSNKTLETRESLRQIFKAPEGKHFTDASIMIGKEFYIATDDGNIYYYEMGRAYWDSEDSIEPKGMVALNDKATSTWMEFNQFNDQPQPKPPSTHTWTSFEYIDDKLVGLTKENQIWTGTIGEHELSNAARVPTPYAPSFKQLMPQGDLKIAEEGPSEEYPFRITIAYCWINKYGPTELGPEYTFYANYPVDEWTAARYLRIHTSCPATAYELVAIEFFYSVGNASEMLFAGRTDRLFDGQVVVFDWYGYVDATSMWAVGNLIAPNENYTEGVKASRVAAIDSRLYFWGSNDEPQRLYIGGNSGNLFSLAAGTGGGFVDVEPGTGQEIKVVTKYKTQSGNSIVTMLCDAPNTHQEQRYNLVENQVSLSNEQNMKSWQAEQVAGSVGCKSFYGAVVCEDGLYSLSRYGLALTTLTMEYNSQIRTNYVSDPIKPVFEGAYGTQIRYSSLIECDGVLYFCLKNPQSVYEWEYDKLIFCYDIDAKAWWTYTLDVDDPLVNMVHIDWEGSSEGIGIITNNYVYLMPNTLQSDLWEPSQQFFPVLKTDFDILLQTGELAPKQPRQNWFYLSQLEFIYDYFIGDITVELDVIDLFGRKITTTKTFSHSGKVYDLHEFMRVDQKIFSYRMRITGKAHFRMTHFMAKLYTSSSKVNLVYGFDDKQTYRTEGDIHPTFKSYNDIREAIMV